MSLAAAHTLRARNCGHAATNLSLHHLQVRHILYLLSILILFVIIFSLLGMEIFADTQHSDPRFADSDYRYDKFINAVTNVFIVLSGENWNEMLYLGWAMKKWLAFFYYVTVLVVCNFVVLNLFVAILLSNIEQIAQIEEEAEKNQLLQVGTTVLLGSTAMVGQGVRTAIDVPLRQLSPTLADGFDVVFDGIRDVGLGLIAAFKGGHDEPDDFCTTLSADEMREQQVEHKRMLAAKKTLGGRLRLRAKWLSESNAWDNCVLLLILFSCIVLAIDLPAQQESFSKTTKDCFTAFDYFITSAFSLELALVLFAVGGANYVRSPWNLLDFLVVVVSWLSIALSGGDHLAMLRALRALRVLKLAAHAPGVRVVIYSLYRSLPAVSHVIAVFVVFLLIFGILGMQLFGGRFSFCDQELFSPQSDSCGPYDGCFAVHDRDACHALNGTWMPPHYGHFDNIGAAVLLLFEMSGLEGWPDVLFWSGNAARDTYPTPTSPFRQPDGPSILTRFYWMAWIFLSAFIIMNMVIGVVSARPRTWVPHLHARVPLVRCFLKRLAPDVTHSFGSHLGR